MPSPIELLYGSNGQAITVTLNSLGSAAARASTAVNNSSTLFEDCLVEVTIKTGASGVAATGYVAIYAAGSVDGGTTYPDGATGTDGAVTQVVPPNSKLIGTLNCVANATVYKSNAMSVAAAFGGTLPQYFVIIVSNQTGAALDASAGGSAQFQGVQHQS
jgi:hypothetical protein